MTPSELKYRVEVHDTETHFFDRKTMQFFGDRMSNYGVKSTTITTWTDEEPIEVWELYRKRPVKHGLIASAYFRKDTFERTFPKREEV
jgi:hypothetical protein